MADITPALTPEEWGALPEPMLDDLWVFADANGGIYGGRAAITGDDVPGNIRLDSPESPRPHAIAALALHGQPFGFTRADLRLLEEAETKLAGGVAPEDYIPFAERVGMLRERIAALLPPEPSA